MPNPKPPIILNPNNDAIIVSFKPVSVFECNSIFVRNSRIPKLEHVSEHKPGIHTTPNYLPVVLKSKKLESRAHYSRTEVNNRHLNNRPDIPLYQESLS